MTRFLSFFAAAALSFVTLSQHSYATETCEAWPVSKLEALTDAAIAARGTKIDRAKIQPGELKPLAATATYSQNAGWLLQYDVLRPNSSVHTFFSMVACNGHVEFAHGPLGR